MFIERYIIDTLSKKLRTNSSKTMRNVMINFIKENPTISLNEYEELAKRTLREKSRVHHIVHESILEAGVARAKYAFIGGSIVGIALNIGEKHGLISFLIPLLMAFNSMLITILTIEISYNLREKAAFDSTVSGFKIDHNMDPDYENNLQELIQIYHENHNNNDIEANLYPINLDNRVYPFVSL